MTPLPKKKISKARKGKRRENIKLIFPKLSVCPNCSALKLPHKACPNCGTYKGKVAKVVKVKTKVTKGGA
ncbi:MAG: 50S ribosomal protein L32 [Candidatus Woykebacteria bacterium]